MRRMRLYEHQSKDLLEEYEIPVTTRTVASDIDAAIDAGYTIGFPVMVKAQAKTSSRGKAGGIKIASNESELRSHASELLQSRIRGNNIPQVLVEEVIDYSQELYLGISLDREKQKVAVMASTEGGVDIEETANKSPEKIARAFVRPSVGLQPYQARDIVYRAGMSSEVVSEIADVLLKMYRLWNQYDAMEVEINPLMLTKRGVIAADAVVRVDDNALYRNPSIETMSSDHEQTTEEKIAEQNGFDYVPLGGDVGVIGNGAGLVMSILDTIKINGGSPANFLDVKGNTTEAKIRDAIEIVLSQKEVEQVIVSVFGGMTKCDEVARGVVSALRCTDYSKQSVFVQLVGTNEQKGKDILAKEEIITCQTVEDAINKAIRMGQGESK